MLESLKKTAGVIGALCMEAVYLIFKVIGIVETYIGLLIDTLTGKHTSYGKIATLAIGVLSVASFYTTYHGMLYFIEAWWICALITLGVQAILLSTSLQINGVLDLDQMSRHKFKQKWVLAASGGIFAASCVIAYILKEVSISYRAGKMWGHVLFLTAIVSALAVLVWLIGNLIHAGSKNPVAGTFLLLIYFAVLGVSSFFSYNSFVPVMYPEEVSRIDRYQEYVLGSVDLLEQVNHNVDTEYYQRVKQLLEESVDRIAKEAKDADAQSTLTAEEQRIYDLGGSIREYQNLQAQLATLEQKETQENTDYKEKVADATQNSGGIGPNARAVLEMLAKEHENNLTRIQSKKQQTEQALAKLTVTAEDIRQYFLIEEKISRESNALDCTEEADTIRALLKKDRLTTEETQALKDAADKIGEAALRIGTEKDRKDEPGRLASVYLGYIAYLTQYDETFRIVLSTESGGTKEELQEAYMVIQTTVYACLEALPATDAVFHEESGETLETSALMISDFYSSLEKLKRNTDPDLSRIEKAVRTFLGNKMIGVVCALMALLIDMMILFVGIVMPHSIDFWREREQHYSRQEFQKILADLLHQPGKNNLEMLKTLINSGTIHGKYLLISRDDVEKAGFNLEMMSLIDLGEAEYVESGAESANEPQGSDRPQKTEDQTGIEERQNTGIRPGYRLRMSFASWFLEYIYEHWDRLTDFAGK